MKFSELAKAIDELMMENFGAALDERNDRRLSLIVENMLTRLKDIKIDDPHAPGAFDVLTAYNYANDYRRSGKYLDAIALYMIASTKDCSGPDPYNNIAGILKLLGFQKSAYESYKVAKLRFPGNYLLILRKSLLSFQLKNDDWCDDLKLLIKDNSTFKKYSQELKNLYHGDEQINDINQMFQEFEKKFKFCFKSSNSKIPLKNKDIKNNKTYEKETQRVSKNFDENGFNSKGYHKSTKSKYDINGFDKNGYDKNGYDKNGFTFEGFYKDTGNYYNELENDKNGFNYYGFDKNGYDKNGFNSQGYNSSGYDKNGFNSQGYNSSGYDKNGFNSQGYDSSGYNKDGFNSQGYDSSGYNKDGFNYLGFDKEGFDKKGFNSNGYNKLGVHKNPKKFNRKKRSQDINLPQNKAVENSVSLFSVFKIILIITVPFFFLIGVLK